MGEVVVYVRANRAAVRRAVAAIPTVALRGGSVARAMMVRCGMTLLGRIRRAFITKARGGVDEAGDSWKPLKPSTIAYSRRHKKKPGNPRVLGPVFSQAKRPPWVPKKTVRAGYAPSYALTTKQRDRWWDLYRRGLAMYRGDKSHAASRAWYILKSEGATTLIEQYGGTKVDILRDTGLLLNSLSPGVNSSVQVFRVLPGEVIVGTNRKWAGTHHRGNPKRGLPQRRLWPEVRRWPSVWWIDILEQCKQGLVDITIQLAKGA
jgi:hypothetical protein